FLLVGFIRAVFLFCVVFFFMDPATSEIYTFPTRRSSDLSFNVANGFYAMFSNVSGVRNTASGYRSLYSNTIGSNNVGIGYQALFDNISGNNNEIGRAHV